MKMNFEHFIFNITQQKASLFLYRKLDVFNNQSHHSFQDRIAAKFHHQCHHRNSLLEKDSANC